MILLTAFEPFGSKGWLKVTNASQAVQACIDRARPGRYGITVLPLGDGCRPALRALLNRQASTGVLAMRESGGIALGHVVLEPFANAIDRPSVWALPGLAAQLASPFAARAEAPGRWAPSGATGCIWTCWTGAGGIAASPPLSSMCQRCWGRRCRSMAGAWAGWPNAMRPRSWRFSARCPRPPHDALVKQPAGAVAPPPSGWHE
jgi:hypothetical protein